jgi:hypothetical protein
MPKATTQDLLEQRAALTPQGVKALERFMNAKQRECKLCGASPLTPCVAAGSNTVRPYFHAVRYRAA